MLNYPNLSPSDEVWNAWIKKQITKEEFNNSSTDPLQLIIFILMVVVPLILVLQPKFVELKSIGWILYLICFLLVFSTK